MMKKQQEEKAKLLEAKANGEIIPKKKGRTPVEVITEKLANAQIKPQEEEETLEEKERRQKIIQKLEDKLKTLKAREKDEDKRREEKELERLENEKERRHQKETIAVIVQNENKKNETPPHEN